MVKSQAVAIAILEKGIRWYDNPPMCVLMISSLESKSHHLNLETGSHADAVLLIDGEIDQTWVQRVLAAQAPDVQESREARGR